MTRLLLADDLDRRPLLRRLARDRDWQWDVVVAPAAVLAEWSAFAQCLIPLGSAGVAAVPGDDVLLAGFQSETLAAASLAAASGAQVRVLADLRLTDEWSYRQYPLAEDVRGRLIPLFVAHDEPAVIGLRDLLRSTGSGGESHLVCECSLPVATISADHIERRFFLDADLFRFLIGEFKTLTAVPVTRADGGVVSQTVTLSGRNQTHVVWSIRSGAEFSWRLMSRGACPAILAQSDLAEFAAEDSGHGGPPVLAAAPLAWNDLLRAFEYVAAMRRSVRRRRTVELQSEALSEKAQFKTLMSATGCGLLLFTLLGTVALLVMGAAFDPRDRLQRASETADLVFTAADFITQSDETGLTPAAEQRLTEALPRMKLAAVPVLLEHESTDVDQARRGALHGRLQGQGVKNPDAMIEVRPLRGRWFGGLMLAAWIALFLPLGVFLLGQLLIVVARDPSTAAPRRKN